MKYFDAEKFAKWIWLLQSTKNQKIEYTNFNIFVIGYYIILIKVNTFFLW